MLETWLNHAKQKPLHVSASLSQACGPIFSRVFTETRGPQIRTLSLRRGARNGVRDYHSLQLCVNLVSLKIHDIHPPLWPNPLPVDLDLPKLRVLVLADLGYFNVKAPALRILQFEKARTQSPSAMFTRLSNSYPKFKVIRIMRPWSWVDQGYVEVVHSASSHPNESCFEFPNLSMLRCKTFMRSIIFPLLRYSPSIRHLSTSATVFFTPLEHNTGFTTLTVRQHIGAMPRGPNIFTKDHFKRYPDLRRLNLFAIEDSNEHLDRWQDPTNGVGPDAFSECLIDVLNDLSPHGGDREIHCPKLEHIKVTRGSVRDLILLLDALSATLDSRREASTSEAPNQDHSPTALTVEFVYQGKKSSNFQRKAAEWADEVRKRYPQISITHTANGKTVFDDDDEWPVNVEPTLDWGVLEGWAQADEWPFDEPTLG